MCNSSPEGFLPEDHEEEEELGLKKASRGEIGEDGDGNFLQHHLVMIVVYLIHTPHLVPSSCTLHMSTSTDSKYL